MKFLAKKYGLPRPVMTWGKYFLLLSVFMAAAALGGRGPAAELPPDFDFTRHSIPLEDIEAGGPPKDGIPSITNPKFLPAGEAAFLRDDDLVLGVEVRGEARAYPVKILDWHEAVNDVVGGTPVLATW